jgi:hypothetical protein
MVQVKDRRFERSAWPISFEVPVEQAENWFYYLQSECEGRCWSSAGLSQLEPRENSGSRMLLAAGVEQLSITWDRARGGTLNVRARPAAALDLAAAQEFFRDLNRRSSAGETDPIHRWGTLEYEGRAWRGELWLSERLRLGPPSTQYERAVFGPRVVIVDAVLDCIGQGHARDAHTHLLEELSLFLSVVTGTRFHLPQTGKAWTWDTAEGISSSVRTLGYIETAKHPGMPVPGTCPPVPLEPQEETEQQRAVREVTQNERAMPADTAKLWQANRALTAERQQQFLAVAAKFQEALLHWGSRGTASFTSMVIACEALKPARPDDQIRPAKRPWRFLRLWVQRLRAATRQVRNTVPRRDRRYSEHNIYNVIEALLGAQAAQRLRTHLFDQKIHPKVDPQAVRNAHFHSGQLYGSEFAHAMMSNFRDPTFDAACRELFKMTKAAIIEWLRRGGTIEANNRPTA